MNTKIPDSARWLPRRLLRWLLLWLVLYGVALWAYKASYSFFRDVLIYQLQIRPAAWILQHSLPDMPLQIQEASIRSPAVTLELRHGCDGVEVWLMLVTALLAYPMPWRRRTRGLAGGTLLVLGLNLVRIVSLFHIALSRPGWMAAAHEFGWPAVMVLSAVGFIFLQFESPATPPPAAGPAA